MNGALNNLKLQTILNRLKDAVTVNSPLTVMNLTLNLEDGHVNLKKIILRDFDIHNAELFYTTDSIFNNVSILNRCASIILSGSDIETGLTLNIHGHAKVIGNHSERDYLWNKISDSVRGLFKLTARQRLTFSDTKSFYSSGISRSEDEYPPDNFTVIKITIDRIEFSEKHEPDLIHNFAKVSGEWIYGNIDINLPPKVGIDTQTKCPFRWQK